MMNAPNFDSLLPLSVTNYLTSASYALHRCDHMQFAQAQHMQIMNICNEPRIYNLLFRKRRRGVPYRLQDARGFTQWGVDGWRAERYFLFFVVTAKNEIVAAVDIKSSNLTSSEIGYWCSEHHRGVMTNTITALTMLMSSAGFVKAHALVLPTNAKSAGVLLRNGFELLGSAERDGITYNKYNKVLTAT